jgi:hypothetical protein
MTTLPPACPECGSPIYIDEAATTVEAWSVTNKEGLHIEERERTVRVALCSTCEFVHEF